MLEEFPILFYTSLPLQSESSAPQLVRGHRIESPPRRRDHARRHVFAQGLKGLPLSLLRPSSNETRDRDRQIDGQKEKPFFHHLTNSGNSLATSAYRFPIIFFFA